jgi:hypothetical protein
VRVEYDEGARIQFSPPAEDEHSLAVFCSPSKTGEAPQTMKQLDRETILLNDTGYVALSFSYEVEGE